ncbi:MAG: glutamate-1-semialdehyde 2,1-aminomutase [Proteobacteria bacterium]|nr:glutamate-1-semialdehyde 2,1-aminomutase [Pseudomonadota bacterium]
MSTGPLSKELFHASLNLIPGGVNSPVRSFRSVGGTPFFVERGKGAKITDADGKQYVDYVMGYGPMILGHAHPDVLEKVQKTIEKGMAFGAPNGFELELAKLVTSAVPSIEKVRFVNSGTEATMSAIRLARAHTDRKKIVKFDGDYHGHGDSFLVEAGSGVATLGIPDSPGVLEEVTKQTISLPYNDLEKVKECFSKYGKEIAAVIIEPVAGNMGVVPPTQGFLQGLREICTEHDALLIFDEVMTGFRVAFGGAQERYSVAPDITCLGKIVGGGMPVGAYGGKAEIMDKVAPAGPMYQAGTMSGNPVSMAAGIKTLKILKDEQQYQNLEYRSQYLADELKKRSDAHNIPVTINRVGSMFTVFFQNGPVTNFNDAKKSDTKRFAKYFHGLLERGVFIPPSQYEAWFVSTAHGEEDLHHTIHSHEQVMKEL